LKLSRRVKLKLCGNQYCGNGVEGNFRAGTRMTTADLDAHAEKRIREMGATQLWGYHGFPASILQH